MQSHMIIINLEIIQCSIRDDVLAQRSALQTDIHIYILILGFTPTRQAVFSIPDETGLYYKKEKLETKDKTQQLSNSVGVKDRTETKYYRKGSHQVKYKVK